MNTINFNGSKYNNKIDICISNCNYQIVIPEYRIELIGNVDTDNTILRPDDIKLILSTYFAGKHQHSDKVQIKTKNLIISKVLNYINSSECGSEYKTTLCIGKISDCISNFIDESIKVLTTEEQKELRHFYKNILARKYLPKFHVVLNKIKTFIWDSLYKYEDFGKIRYLVQKEFIYGSHMSCDAISNQDYGTYCEFLEFYENQRLRYENIII